MESTSSNSPLNQMDPRQLAERHCQLIDWFSEGQARTVTIGAVEVTVRLVARKGRRGRIAIIAPPGATFRSVSE